MKLHFTVKNLFTFFLFGCLMGEAHEISHFLVGKVACGCWPITRDFNAWELCNCPREYFAEAAGPIFSLTLAWIGAFLLKGSPEKQSLGFALIWANVPQARIFTALMGGGDEMVAIHQLTQNTFLYPYFRLITCTIVLVIALPPIIMAFYHVKNRFGWLINIAFMIGSLMTWALYLFGLMNKVLFSGFLAKPWIMGTPLLITLHTIFVLILFLVFRKHLFTMVSSNKLNNALSTEQSPQLLKI